MRMAGPFNNDFPAAPSVGAMKVTPATVDWAALRGVIAGEVLRPGAPGYEQARKPAIAQYQAIRPQAVVRCLGPADVAETISFARCSQLPVAARSGGHDFAGHSSTQGIVIDVTPMRAVSVSGDVATVGAGARLAEVYQGMAGLGLAIPAGCGPDVGIAGLTLGGGLGILGRQHGLTCDRLLGAQVVLADGRVVDCDGRHHQDLFWALRGAGGGNFGVLTSLVFRTVTAPHLTVFHLTWPQANAVRLIEAWQSWAPGAPDEMAASLLVTASGDTGAPPVCHVFGAMTGPESTATGLLADLVARAGTDPVSMDSKYLPFLDSKRYLAELGDQMTAPSAAGQPSPRSFSKSEYFGRPLTPAAIVALVSNFQQGRVSGQSRELDFSPWAGAYNRVPTAATAFAHRDARFLLKHAVTIGADTPADGRAAAHRWLTRSWAAVHPLGTGGVYPNFPDPGLADWAHAYHGSNYGRLRQVKAGYDPGNFFRFHQSIPPASDF
jgi:FAD/FMN-containing dehydrogenase